jgi:hypothetical protein
MGLLRRHPGHHRLLLPFRLARVGPRPFLGAFTLALVVACTGSTVEAGETTAAAVTTTPSIVTITVPPGTSTTIPATTTTSPTTTVPEGPSGSGCTPGDATTLPEGEWFGLVVSASASGIEFDLACMFSGEAAAIAAAEDGEESPPPNDYYVRNDNPLVRFLPVSPAVEVTWYPTGDPTSEVTVTFPEWDDGVTTRGLFFGVWLDVIDGEVLRIREQWVP